MNNPPTIPASSWRRLFGAFGSLRAAIVLTVLVGVTVPSVIGIHDEGQRLRAEHDLTLDDDLGRATTLLALALREPMWQIAPEQAESIIDASLLTDSRIVSITARDTDGRPFAARERAHDDSAPTLVHTRPVVKDEKNIGVVLVEMSTAGFQQKYERLWRDFLWRGLVSLLASISFIWLVLHWRLVLPVRRLVAISEKLAGGQLDESFRSLRQDELGRLTRSLETTRQALAGLIATLEERNATLMQLNDQLESRVVERTRSLEDALGHLRAAQQNIVESEKLASLGRVVAGVAHELNTPIGNALVVATTISEHLEPLETELAEGKLRRSTLVAAIAQARDGLELLERSLGKAAKMIGDFKQVAVDQTSEQRRDFDLGEVTLEVIGTLEPLIKRSAVRLDIALAPGIHCDSYPGPYGQVLTNLVMNAFLHAFPEDAAGDGQVISIRTERCASDRARLVVSDNGIGMSPEIRRRIFDPFFTTRLGRGGSGLGMNIVHGFVVRVLKGTIAVDSAPNAGATFTIEFPLSPAPDAPGDQAFEAGAPS